MITKQPSPTVQLGKLSWEISFRNKWIFNFSLFSSSPPPPPPFFSVCANEKCWGAALNLAVFDGPETRQSPAVLLPPYGLSDPYDSLPIQDILSFTESHPQRCAGHGWDGAPVIPCQQTSVTASSQHNSARFTSPALH